MSDDRFKQARKDLYDKHNQRQQDVDYGGFEDEATSLVDIGGMNSQPASTRATVPPPLRPNANPPPIKPNPPSSSSLALGHAHGENFGEENTQFLTLDASNALNASERTQMLTLDEDTFSSTDNFSSNNDNANSTEFINIAEIQAQGNFEGGDVLSDTILRQNYQYSAESIQQGTTTLIFAQNNAGHSVILKRIWEQDSALFPPELNQQIAALDALRHPNFVHLNGMLATPTGVWVELSRPPGYRLSDVISQNGPQPEEVVFGWLGSVADALHVIHSAGFVHASLTPDTIWVQTDGSAMLEPFGILSFEERGDLSPYGPREMSFPPEQRELSSATDTFCLANIAFVALTGLPLDFSKVNKVSPKVGKLLQRGLSLNPSERFQSAQEFVKPFRVLTEGKKNALPNIDVKYLIIGVGVLLFSIVGILYFVQQSNAKDAAIEAEKNKLPIPFVVPEKGPDPRLKILVDLESDPISKIKIRMDRNAEADADRLRVKAEEYIQGIEKYGKGQQRKQYRLSLAAIVKAIRLTGGTPEDLEFLKDLHQKKPVIAIRKKYFKEITAALLDNDLSAAKLNYQHLSAIELEIPAMNFFNSYKTANIKKLYSVEDIEGEE